MPTTGETTEHYTQADGFNEDVHEQSKRKRYIPEHLKSFTWNCFTTTMATGALAIALYQTPYKFTGLVTIGKIIFILDLILFIAFTIAIASRFALRPKAFLESLYDSDEAFYFGTWWVSLALIIENMAQYALPPCGPWLVKTLEVLFWMYFACILVVAVLQYQYLFVTRNLEIPDMTPSWLLPIYPLLVTGPLAAVLVQYQPPASASPMWIAGLAAQGLGWMVTVFMYGMWAIRLLCEDVPAPPMRAGMYIAVGPTGKTRRPISHESDTNSQRRLHHYGHRLPRRLRLERPSQPLPGPTERRRRNNSQRHSRHDRHIPLATGILVLRAEHSGDFAT